MGKSVTYLNPAFDQRMLSIGNPRMKSAQLQRGRMVVSGSTLSGKQGVRFLYNPISVEADHSVNQYYNDMTMSAQAFNPQNSNSMPMGGLGSSSFSLLFDRTYEVWENLGSAGTYGCYVDVLAFYRATGIVTENISLKATPHRIGPNTTLTTTESSVWSNLYPDNGIDMGRIVDVYIGPRLRYRGYMTSLSVTYSHFSVAMIPVRCEVDISINFIVGQAANNNNPTVGGPKVKKATVSHQ